MPGTFMAQGCAGRQTAFPRTQILMRGYVVSRTSSEGKLVNRIVYIVGAIVIIVALLSFFGLR